MEARRPGSGLQYPAARRTKLTDREIVLLYREWSESCYAASFLMLPGDGSLPNAFLDWLQVKLELERPWFDYEQDLINRWRRAEETK